MLEKYLEQDFTFAVHVHDTVSPICYQCQKNEGIIESRMEILDLFVFLWHFDIVTFAEYHLKRAQCVIKMGCNEASCLLSDL